MDPLGISLVPALQQALMIVPACGKLGEVVAVAVTARVIRLEARPACIERIAADRDEARSRQHFRYRADQRRAEARRIEQTMRGRFLRLRDVRAAEALPVAGARAGCPFLEFAAAPFRFGGDDACRIARCRT